jgi:prolyl-tRNA synthetase
MVLRKVEQIIREEMDGIGAQEVHFPALLPAEPFKLSRRWDDYGPNLFRLRDRKEVDMVLAPTHEEVFTLLVKDLYSSYKDLPLVIYQIQTKHRDEARPRAGLLRGREFVMKDAYSFDIDDAGLARAYEDQRAAYQRIFERLGLETVIVTAMSGAMGGSRSEEFLHPTPIGEDTYVRSPGGYAANVEAVHAMAPPPLPIDGQAPAHVGYTPGATTIASLVDAANRLQPRADGRAWRASDTLKNVVLAITHPDSRREVIVLGVPGNRDVDLARVAAGLFPAEVEAATDEDFANHPELVPGYIGPGVLGINAKDPAKSVRYFLDPRVVEGTSWITGADQPDHHVFCLVAGRDFVAAGQDGQPILDAAEVLDGDPAPDGSGPLSRARGIELGHLFQLGRKYAEALGLKVLDQNGKLVTVVMGSYGIGVTRALATVAERYADERGLVWPLAVAPAHVHVVATGKDQSIFDAADELSAQLENYGIEVLYDDRPRLSAGVKFADAELIGVPFIAVVGKGLAEGVIELRDRRSGVTTEVSAGGAAVRIAGIVGAAGL